MPRNGSPSSARALQLLRATPPKFVCAWSQEITLRPCPMHDHDVIELVYHPSGRGVTQLANGTSLAYSEGGVVLYSAQVKHDQKASQPGADVCVHVQVSKRVAALFPSATYYPPVSDPYVGEEFWSLSRTPPQPDEALGAVLDLRVTALLLRLHIAENLREQALDPQTAYLQKARQYLQEYFATVPNAAVVAEHVGVSEDYLRHLFREREGTTLNQVLTRIRIERAKELLRHSRLPLKAVAELCGFQNERYFCTRFAAFAGLTPGKVRNQPRGPKPPPLPGES
jgi:AraC-like DNA-binding protein